MKLKGISILVVDDEQDLRDTVMEIFEAEGAKVFGAHDSQSAFAMIQKQKFDVVMSDVRMPGGDGVDLLHHIEKSLTSKPKIFLCSGYNDLTPLDATRLGVIEMFSKPFNLNNMITSIARAVS